MMNKPIKKGIEGREGAEQFLETSRMKYENNGCSFELRPFDQYLPGANEGGVFDEIGIYYPDWWEDENDPAIIWVEDKESMEPTKCPLQVSDDAFQLVYTEPCAECDGSGETIPNDTEHGMCKDCNGMGDLTHVVVDEGCVCGGRKMALPFQTFGYTDDIEIKCSKCQGTGKSPKTQKIVEALKYNAEWYMKKTGECGCTEDEAQCNDCLKSYKQFREATTYLNNQLETIKTK